jgi:hypothetical protein
LYKTRFDRRVAEGDFRYDWRDLGFVAADEEEVCRVAGGEVEDGLRAEGVGGWAGDDDWTVGLVGGEQMGEGGEVCTGFSSGLGGEGGDDLSAGGVFVERRHGKLIVWYESAKLVVDVKMEAV